MPTNEAKTIQRIYPSVRAPRSNRDYNTALLRQVFDWSVYFVLQGTRHAKYSGSDKIRVMVDNKNDIQASCPYCASKFRDNEELSKHIDRIHHGSGLLEGNSRNW